jgi:hypothetical protein
MRWVANAVVQTIPKAKTPDPSAVQARLRF